MINISTNQITPALALLLAANLAPACAFPNLPSLLDPNEGLGSSDTEQGALSMMPSLIAGDV